MLDGKTAEILGLINGYCENGCYKVITVEEIISLMPKNHSASVEGVRESIKLLREKEFIKVKYEDDNEFCLCTLPKGRLFYENKNDEEVKDFIMKKKYFFMGFLGSFFGSVICFLIFVVFCLLLR